MSKIFVGIDVCEKKLDVFLYPIGIYKQFSNNKRAVKQLCKFLSDYKIEKVILEATGKLELCCANELYAQGFAVSVVNPAQVCYFRRSLGRKNKTDAVDAEVIARFGEVMEPALFVARTKEQEELKELSVRRNQLVGILTAERHRLRRNTDKICQKDLKEHIEFLTIRLNKIEEAILLLIKSNKEYLRKYYILKSFKGVGDTLAMSLICNFPELGLLNQKQVASLAGVIPLNAESGTMFSSKSMKYNGRKNVRYSLYLATLVAMRYNKSIQYHYERLQKKGKSKKVAMGCCMRKIIIILNSLIKEDRTWIEKHPFKSIQQLQL